jgi:hypothetical protein
MHLLVVMLAVCVIAAALFVAAIVAAFVVALGVAYHLLEMIFGPRPKEPLEDDPFARARRIAKLEHLNDMYPPHDNEDTKSACEDCARERFAASHQASQRPSSSWIGRRLARMSAK